MTEPDARRVKLMPEWSAYAGEPFNLTERRPLSILSEDAETLVVDGFYHWGRFWKAVIPRRGVAEIIGQRFNFSKRKRREDGSSRPSVFFANHVQARVRMAPERAVRLYEEGREAGEPAHYVADFCYSVEAVGPYGRKWNLTDAVLGNLAIVHRFLSIEADGVTEDHRQCLCRRHIGTSRPQGQHHFHFMMQIGRGRWIANGDLARTGGHRVTRLAEEKRRLAPLCLVAGPHLPGMVGVVAPDAENAPDRKTQVTSRHRNHDHGML
jgi:hypothetical protein